MLQYKMQIYFNKQTIGKSNNFFFYINVTPTDDSLKILRLRQNSSGPRDLTKLIIVWNTILRFLLQYFC